jgi:hypothetical protein
LYRAAWSCCQTVLSAVLSEAVELGAIRTNPAVRLRLPAPPRRDNQIVLTTEEITALADAVDPAYEVAIIRRSVDGLARR